MEFAIVVSDAVQYPKAESLAKGEGSADVDDLSGEAPATLRGGDSPPTTMLVALSTAEWRSHMTASPTWRVSYRGFGTMTSIVFVH